LPVLTGFFPSFPNLAKNNLRKKLTAIHRSQNFTSQPRQPRRKALASVGGVISGLGGAGGHLLLQ
jgi:hypothetical protein